LASDGGTYRNTYLLSDTYIRHLMWHLTQIPCTLYTYWGYNKLPYLRFLTLASFRRHNPDWKIILYRPILPQKDILWKTNEQRYNDNYKDCINEVKNIGVTMEYVDFDSIDFTNSASDVHKSDYIRWKLLYETGGLWADMDIIFIKSMDDLYFNTPDNATVNAVFCISYYGHSIGFLMGVVDNDYFKTIHKTAIAQYAKERYQCMGSLLCNKLFPNWKSAQKGNIVLHNLSMEVVYPYDANHVKELFITETPSKITEKTIGIHWYGGSDIAGKYLNTTNGGLQLQGSSIIDEYIRKLNIKT